MTQDLRRPAARRPLLAAAVALAFASPLAAPLASPPVAANAAPANYNQFIVKFKDGSVEHASKSQRQQRLDAVGRAQGLHIGQLRRLAVGADVIRTDRVLDATEIKALIGKLRADPRVEYAEVDLRVTTMSTPNDTSYSSQWHYFDAIGGINAPTAWDVTTGTGQVVAVLDTGITAHPDLDANVVVGWDFVSDSTAANDGDGRDGDNSDPGDWCTAQGTNSSWHGTHVAGTIAAVTNNSLGVAGVAYGAKVQPIRVLGMCGGSLSDINDAIVWASGGTVAGTPPNPTPAKVINLSLGGGGACGASTQTAINTAVANGATIVVSAGNSNANASGYTPASCANVITVAATGPTGARASYSNYGTSVEIAAPGGDGAGANAVLSTLNTGTTVPVAPTYVGYNGTSMAAPHISGVVALVNAAADTPLTPAEMTTLLQATSRTFPVACPLGCGTGIVDAAAAVLSVSSPVLTVVDPVATAEGDSGTQSLTFKVKLSQAVATNTTFDIATADGTAAAGSDYVAKTSLGVVIPAGSTSVDFVVTVNGDTAPELDETFSVNVDNVVGEPTVLDDTGSATIVNDDVTTLTNGVAVTGLSGAVNAKSYYKLQVPAGATNLVFTMTGGTGDADLYVRYGSMPTEAAYDCRPYTGTSNESCPMTMQAGTWYVMVHGFSAYSGVSLVGSYTAPAYDTAISVGDASITEGNTGTKVLTFTATLANVSAGTVGFDIATTDGTATAGSDYVAKTSTSQTIPAGQLSKTFAVTLNGDHTVESNETFTVNLTNVTGANVTDAQGTGTITNDDGPTLSIADAGFQEGNSGTKTLTFTVTLSQASIYAVTYSIGTFDGMATAGTDFVGSSLTGQTIPAGQTSKTFSVTVNGDTAVEGNETMFVRLSSANVPVTDSQARGMLINDDGATLSISDATISEGDVGNKVLTFTVSLSQAAPAAVTFNFSTAPDTASGGTDFDPVSLTGVKIPQGQTSKLVAVTIRGDVNVEADETFRGNIAGGNVSIVDGVGIATITNDD